MNIATLLAFFIHLIVGVDQLLAQIIYPDLNDFPTNCKLRNGDSGTCRKYADCAPAQKSIEDPVKCYFDRGEYYVCCEKERTLPPVGRLTQRPAKQVCPDVFYYLNGLPTEPEDWRYMVALGWETYIRNLYDYRCGGILVESRFAITAAHCVADDSNQPVVVLPGGVNLTDTTMPRVRIEEIFVHPDYNPLGYYHDIAVIKLADWKTNFSFACLPLDLDLTDAFVDGIGYGHTRFGGKSSDQLLRGNLQIISNEECRRYYEADDSLPDGIIESQICAKDPKNITDSCQGDSGGPLIRHSPPFREYVVGITSFGIGCRAGQAGVYTRISAYLDWIEGIVWKDN